MNKKEQSERLTPLEMQRITEEIMRELGVSVSAALKAYFPNSGFVLLVFPFNNPGIANYLSNAERQSMVMALKETAKRLEGHEDISIGSGAVH